MVKKIPLILLSLAGALFWPMQANCSANTIEQAKKYEADANYKQAEAIYESMMAGEPGSNNAFRAQKELILLYIVWEKEAAARAALDEFVINFQHHEQIAEAVDCIGDMFYYKAKKYQPAQDAYEYAVQLWPDEQSAMGSLIGLARSSIRQGDDPNASAAIARLLERPSVEGEKITKLADVYLELEKYAKARELYQWVVDNRPQYEDAMEVEKSAAISSVFLGDDAAAAKTMDSLVGKFSADDDIVSVLNDVADAYLRQQKREKADQIYRRVLQTWPQNEDAIWSQTELAKSQIVRGDDPNADIAVSKVLGDFGQNEGVGQAARELADAYAAAGKYEKACDLYRYLVDNRREDGDALEAQMQLTMLRIRLWDLDGAETELGKLLSQFSQDDDLGDAVHEIVEEYRNTGAHEESRGLFNYLLEEWSGGEETMLELQVGVALQSIKLGELDKADAAVAKLIADYNDSPKIGKALFQIAEELFYAHKYPKTIELLELIRSDYPDKDFPSKMELPFILAVCYERLQDYDSAIENYRRCVEEYPAGRFSPRAPYAAGLVCMRSKKDYEQAVYWFELQRRLYPKVQWVGYTLRLLGVCCLVHIEDYAKGAEAFEQYIAQYPDGADIWSCFHGLAQCYAKMGDSEQALAVLQRAYEKAQTDDELQADLMAQIKGLENGGVK